MISTAWFFGDRDLQDAHCIRRAVFIEEQQIDEAVELDGTDSACAHLVVYADGIPAATGRIMITRDEFLIGRVAVLPAYRGQHLGVLVTQMLIHACYEMGSERQTVHAQLSAQNFYTKLGFTVCGDVYEEAGIPHIPMEHYGDSQPLCRHQKEGSHEAMCKP